MASNVVDVVHVEFGGRGIFICWCYELVRNDVWESRSDLIRHSDVDSRSDLIRHSNLAVVT
jgi:hypothetical protein